MLNLDIITMDTLMDILMDMVIMDIMERERQSLLLSLVTTIMDILIMEVMVTMDIMARGKLRQLLLLSLVTTIMIQPSWLWWIWSSWLSWKERGRGRARILPPWIWSSWLWRTWLWLSWLIKQLFICSKTSAN